MGPARSVIPLVLATLLAVSCDDDGGGVSVDPDLGRAEAGAPDGPAPDRGGPDRGGMDGATQDTNTSGTPDAGAGDGAGPDLVASPDAAWPSVCDPTCLKISPELCTRDSSGQCVECTKTEHCAKNPLAYGPTCNTAAGWCVCAKDADCAGRYTGHVCLPYANACGCTSDAHCAAGLRCVGQYVGQKVCKVPCKADKDCTDTTRPLCDTATGRCEACVSDADCASTAVQGARCLSDEKGNKQCGCREDSHCKGNRNGPTCHAGYRRCTCAADAQCTTAPYTLCTLVHKGGAYAQCHKACASPTDCGKGLACLFASSKCGECLSDAHCTASSAPHCQAGTSTCVACTKDSQCTGSAKYCAPTLGICRQCLSDAHCAGTKATPHCDPLYQSCFECAEDKHCKGGYTWGNRCIFNMFVGRICRCESSADCAGSAMGPTCFATFMKCSCAKDADCTVAPHTKCLLPYPGAAYKRCQKPCTTDAQCVSLGMAPVCHKASGACVGCLTDADCATGTKPFCDKTTLECVGCKTGADCASSLYGTRCDGGVCTCAAATDCPAATTWGPACVGTSSRRCGCTKAADCATSTRGAVCDATYGICACVTTTDCPTGKTCTGKSVVGTGVCQ